jgi:hypothetical protein
MRHLALGIQAFAVGIEDQRSTISVGMHIGETARDHADFCRCFKTGAAVFLHDDGGLLRILLTEIP